MQYLSNNDRALDPLVVVEEGSVHASITVTEPGIVSRSFFTAQRLFALPIATCGLKLDDEAV